MDVKDPTLSMVKSRRIIASILNKLQIPAITSRGHCISSTAVPSANDARSLVLHINEEAAYCVTHQNHIDSMKHNFHQTYFWQM